MIPKQKRLVEQMVAVFVVLSICIFNRTKVKQHNNFVTNIFINDFVHSKITRIMVQPTNTQTFLLFGYWSRHCLNNTCTLFLVIYLSFPKEQQLVTKPRGPGALCRAQEYHCNLALFYFSTWKLHKTQHFAPLKYLKENKLKWLSPIQDTKTCQKLNVRMAPKITTRLPKCF